MARSVSLSDEAFRILRAEKREGESDSDVVLRLAREAHSKGKDPMAFLERRAARRWDAATFDTLRARMRDADVEAGERRYRERAGGA